MSEIETRLGGVWMYKNQHKKGKDARQDEGQA